MTSCWRIIAPLLPLVLISCATSGRARGTQSSDRALARAESLYKEKGRPQDAEKLIRRAIEDFSAKKEETGLADAYHQYAYLLSSPALNKSRDAFLSGGFADRSITWRTHLAKSIDYFDRAATIYARLKRFDKLTENSIGRGLVYADMRNFDEACASFDQGVSFHEEALKQNPAFQVAVPVEYKGWPGYLNALRKWAGCGG